DLPVNHRIEIEEGAHDFVAEPFAKAPTSYERASQFEKPETLPSSIETWLIEPLNAPEFSLPDLAGNTRELRSFRGNAVLLSFWSISAPASLDQLVSLQKFQST